MSNSNDSFLLLEVEKQSKTKMDTEIDQPLLMPERKAYRIYLDGTHEGDGSKKKTQEDGFHFERRYLESQEWLSYHTKFLEKVFGSRASEMIKPSCGVIDIFVALLTEEELNKLGGWHGWSKDFCRKNLSLCILLTR
ncbi:hypothetical protein RHGRI_023855 [Rhododendron griersonianum]|uniref:Uncharacterized protein n=1 Tax=Rhododendron griersonianum TaxID=479676 RepID=A0AAV6J9I5_9ERIC|nr:hypothetical protein RHGRI_023855 [Rhododendron griersonianum]